MQKGFTLVELIVVIAVIAVLSSIVLFSVTQYINKGKDSNISGLLVTMPAAGESYYNYENETSGDGYTGFCELSNSVIKNILLQLPINPGAVCYSDKDLNNTSTWSTEIGGNPKGLCCAVQSDGDAWAACMTEFTKSVGDTKLPAFCVDSRGVRKQITYDQCNDLMALAVKECP